MNPACNGDTAVTLSRAVPTPLVGTAPRPFTSTDTAEPAATRPTGPPSPTVVSSRRVWATGRYGAGGGTEPAASLRWMKPCGQRPPERVILRHRKSPPQLSSET